MILFALILVIVPVDGIVFVILFISLALTIRGLGNLVYYFQMARSMVGGKIMLYRGIITLDLGLFIGHLATKQGVFLILGTSAVNAVAGVFSILRAYESKKIGSSQWILSLINGILMVSLLIVVILSCIFQKQPTFAMYVFATELVISAIQKIIESLKKTAIAYIP
jgi:uncharacterized membrane protein HdeD (DUF308 family)